MSEFNEAFVAVYLLDASGGARQVDIQDLEAIHSHPNGVWIHTHYANHSVLERVQKVFELDDIILEALMAESTRPRTTPFEEGLLMALRGVNLNAGENPEDMVSVRLWVNEKLMLSTAKYNLVSVNDLEAQLQKGRGALNTSDLLVELIDRLVWRMSDTVDAMEDKVALLEEQMVEHSSDNLRLHLSTLRRQSIAVRRHLAPERDALARLMNEKIPWLGEDNKIYLREINDRLIRHIEDIDAVRERAAITHEELNSRHSEQLNSKMYLLSVVAAIFLPLGFLTGLLGINVGGIPGADNPKAFLIFSGILVSAVFVQIIIFRWKKWL